MQVRIDTFILERVAEDEARASDLADAWRGVHWLYATQDEADYLDRWSPARVLAECEAKRRVVADIMRNDYVGSGETDGLAERALSYMAAVYAVHPDFDPAWRL